MDRDPRRDPVPKGIEHAFRLAMIREIGDKEFQGPRHSETKKKEVAEGEAKSEARR